MIPFYDFGEQPNSLNDSSSFKPSFEGAEPIEHVVGDRLLLSV